MRNLSFWPQERWVSARGKRLTQHQLKIRTSPLSVPQVLTARVRSLRLEFLFVRRSLTFAVHTAFPPGFVQIRCCCLFCLDLCNRLSTPSFLLIRLRLDSATHFVSCLILVNQEFFYFLVLRPPYIHKTLEISKRFCLYKLHFLILTIISINPMELENVCY